MTYVIIGGDGKEYGPVSGAELRQWISEGRLNAQSLAKAESDAEFRALATFPELADVFKSAPPPLNAPPPFSSGIAGDARALALQAIKSPAVALKVTAILNLVLALWSLGDKIFSHPNLQQFNLAMQQMNNPQMEQFMKKMMNFAYGPAGIADGLFGLVISILIFVGATKMRSLRSYEFAFTTAILAMIPCLTPCCFLGLPFGIWALTVLTKPAVKSQFT